MVCKGCGRQQGHPVYCPYYEGQDCLDSHEFYNLMQAYRHAECVDQIQVKAAYEAVKQYIRQHIPN
jgi:hypothetical protein